MFHGTSTALASSSFIIDIRLDRLRFVVPTQSDPHSHIKAQMPGLTGLDLSPIIKRTRPNLQVVLTAPKNFHGPKETNKQVDLFTSLEQPADSRRMGAVTEKT
jgi:hypothetical protein